MKTIELTQGQIALVDDEDYPYLMQFKWYAVKKVNTYYAKSIIGGIYMHRLILGITDSKIEVDHKDMNGLNDQKYNIRVATRSQNQMNRKKYGNYTSIYKGVSWHKHNKKWIAHISKDCKCIHLGLFDCPIEAALVRDKAAKKYHGEFADLNFPQFA